MRLKNLCAHALFSGFFDVIITREYGVYMGFIAVKFEEIRRSNTALSHQQVGSTMRFITLQGNRGIIVYALTVSNSGFVIENRAWKYWQFDENALFTEYGEKYGMQYNVAYDENLSPVSVTTPGERVFDITTDRFGRIAEVSAPDGTTVNYVYNEETGNLSEVIDQAGYTLPNQKFNIQSNIELFYENPSCPHRKSYKRIRFNGGLCQR